MILGKRIKSLKKFLLDSTVPKRKKLLVIFGIIYILAPIDFIPITVLGFGIIDDIVVWLFILTHLSAELDKYWKESTEEDHGEGVEAVNAAEKYKGETVIDVSGRVTDDGDDADA